MDRLDLDCDMGCVTRENLKNTFFAGLMTLKMFYSRLRPSDKDKWNIFLGKLDNKIKNNTIVDVRKIGMPKNWLEILRI